MKKYLLTSLFVFSCLNAAYSQRSERYEDLINDYSSDNMSYIFSVRASGIFTFGSELWNDASAFGADYSLGVHADVLTSSEIWLGLGVEFLSRTYGYTHASFSGRYISIPLNVSSRGENFYAKTGFHFDFNVSNTTKYDDIEVDIQDDSYNKFRMGIHCEAGYCGWKHFDVGVCLGWTFTNFLNSELIDEYTGDWNMGVVVAYKF